MALPVRVFTDTENQLILRIQQVIATTLRAVDASNTALLTAVNERLDVQREVQLADLNQARAGIGTAMADIHAKLSKFEERMDTMSGSNSPALQGAVERLIGRIEELNQKITDLEAKGHTPDPAMQAENERLRAELEVERGNLSADEEAALAARVDAALGGAAPAPAEPAPAEPAPAEPAPAEPVPAEPAPTPGLEPAPGADTVAGAEPAPATDTVAGAGTVGPVAEPPPSVAGSLPEPTTDVAGNPVQPS